jgi:hypothetical protein
LSPKSFSSKMSKNKVLNFFKVRNKILKKSSVIVKIQTQWIDKAKKIGLKSQIAKDISAFCQKSDFFVFGIFFSIFYPKDLKIRFPTNFAMLYPNLQNKLRICDIFEFFLKKSKNRLFGKSRIKNRKNRKSRNFFIILCVKWAGSYFVQKKIWIGRDRIMARTLP